MLNNYDFLSRAQGALLGLAVGDAVGTTLEFKPKAAVEPITDLVGGGPFNLQAGQWTDDTSMALCLADSLLHCQGHDASDQAERYVRWRDEGYNSCTGHCFDIGMTVSTALNTFLSTGNPESGPSDAYSAGNGSIMRLAPVAIYYAPNKGVSFETLEYFSAKSSLTTHGEERAVEACRILAYLLGLIFSGAHSKAQLAELLIERFHFDEDESNEVNQLRNVLNIATLPLTTRDHIYGRGFVVDSLEAALWCFMQTESFSEGALLAANLGDDADTTAAIYGQIAGAFYGVEGIPNDWLEKLAWRQHIEDIATRLASEMPSDLTQQ